MSVAAGQCGVEILLHWIRQWLGYSPLLQALGKELLMLQLPVVRVPEGCVSLLLDKNHQIQVFYPGQRVYAKEKQQLFCIYPDYFEIGFAPDLMAPELGVSLTLQFHSDDPRLAMFLSGRQQLDYLELTLFVQGLIGQDILLPAMTQEELRDKRYQAREQLQEYGIDCLALRKVDLSDQVSASRQLWEKLQERGQQKAAKNSDKAKKEISSGACETHSLSESWQHELCLLVAQLGMQWQKTSVPDWHRLETLDQRLLNRLLSDLPVLKLRLAKLRELWRQEKGGYEINRRLKNMEQLLFNQIQRLELAPVIGTKVLGLEIDLVRAQKIMMQVKQVVKIKKQLQHLVHECETELTSSRLEQMAILLEAMVEAINYRLGLADVS